MSKELKYNKTQLINKINELDSKKRGLFNQLFKIFKDEMKDFIVQNNYKSIKCRINNHEWNDGDNTYFSFCWDYVDIKKNDRSEEEGISLDFCREYPDDFWEAHFSEWSERIYFSVKNGELEIN